MWLSVDQHVWNGHEQSAANVSACSRAGQTVPWHYCDNGTRFSVNGASAMLRAGLSLAAYIRYAVAVKDASRQQTADAGVPHVVIEPQSTAVRAGVNQKQKYIGSEVWIKSTLTRLLTMGITKEMVLRGTNRIQDDAAFMETVSDWCKQEQGNCHKAVSKLGLPTSVYAYWTRISVIRFMELKTSKCQWNPRYPVNSV